MAQRNFKPTHASNTFGRRYERRKDWLSMYDRDWQAYCRKFLVHNGRCYACGKPATEVDHLEPHKGDEILFKKTDNHLPLCAYCHSRVTALFDKNFKPGYSIKPKLEWLAKSRLARGLTFRVIVMPGYP